MQDLIIKDFIGIGKMIEIPCSTSYGNSESLYVCKNTGLVRAKDLRNSDEIANAWSDKVYSEDFGENTYTARIPAVKARQVYVADYADVNIGLKGKTLCDIGAGEGQFLEIAGGSDYQANVFGIEPSGKNCLQLKKKNLANFNGTIEDFSKSTLFEKQKFDIITIMWTLVNCHSCLDMVSMAYDMLKPDGYLVIGEGSRILVPFKKPLNYYFGTLPQDLHAYHFSANSLKNLLKVCNFKITHENRYIDSDILCVIGKKVVREIEQEYEIDNYLEVLNFFERWDKETQKHYLPKGK